MTAPSYTTYPYQAAQPTPVKTHSWLEDTHPEYAACAPKWRYARDHYTGECAAPATVATYLIRKKIGETTEAFEERVLLADYTPHFSAVVDTLAGMLANIEDDATRTWGRTARGRASRRTGPLGAPRDRDTQIGRLYADADGEGNGWLTLWQLLATDLVAVHDAWVLVDGADGVNPRVKVVQAEDVLDWREEDGVIVEAKMVVRVDVRAGIKDGGVACEKQWIVFTVDGWQRWREVKVKDGTSAAVEADGPGAAGAYAYVTRDGKRTIPLFCVELALRRNVGFMMAQKANAIFNKESERDHLLRFACFPLLNVHANDNTFKKIVEALRAGSRVLQVATGATPHSYAAPDSGPAATLTTAIDAKTNDFYTTAFREFGTAARTGRDRVTATEVKADVAIGISAFLALLRAAVDTAENTALYLLEQTLFPGDSAKWGMANVERSHDFAPFDVNLVIERMRTRYFGQNVAVPIGPAGRSAVAKEIAAWDGIEVVDAEIDKETEAAPGAKTPGAAVDSMPPPGPAPAG